MNTRPRGAGRRTGLPEPCRRQPRPLGNAKTRVPESATFFA